MKTPMEKLQTRIVNAQKRLGVMMASLMINTETSTSQISIEIEQKQLGKWRVVSTIEKVQDAAQ